MVLDLANWKTQIRKGYLELSILSLIEAHGRLYGFDIIERLANVGLHVKEGTLYPLLNRMTTDDTLFAEWETENLRGHPRKFYSLTKTGAQILKQMMNEFEDMNEILEKIKSTRRKS